MELMLRDLHRYLLSVPFHEPGGDTPHAELVAVSFSDDLGTCITEEPHGGRVEW